MNKTGILNSDLKLPDLNNTRTQGRFILISLLSALFIIYPNISIFSLERQYVGEQKHTAQLLFFGFRYLYFSGLIWFLIWFNLRKISEDALKSRLLQAFVITVAAYIIYTAFSMNFSPKKEWYSGLLIFQFFVMFIFSVLLGHVTHLYYEQRRKEQVIEQLKIENLQSRYNALTNQINPHFFFNSLNGLTSVIRRKNPDDALEYVNKLSDVFRYILQSDKKGLVNLGEELDFLKAFFYMLEIRFANKLVFMIDVPDEKKDLRIPVLSLLPLVENVVMHNTIDSEHNMIVNICLNELEELSVSNPVFPKLVSSDSNGTGLRNLENRFSMLMNTHIRVKNDGVRFTVYLPLKKEKNENPDS
ncbi:MAG TPA: histidine kinase [Bacteroidales bacterium]|jgi:sensor histidine kinase YesM|nr:histidine kinase [Bacteroidales bacterium]